MFKKPRPRTLVKSRTPLEACGPGNPHGTGGPATPAARFEGCPEWIGPSALRELSPAEAEAADVARRQRSAPCAFCDFGSYRLAHVDGAELGLSHPAVVPVCQRHDPTRPLVQRWRVSPPKTPAADGGLPGSARPPGAERPSREAPRGAGAAGTSGGSAAEPPKPPQVTPGFVLREHARRPVKTSPNGSQGAA